MRFARRIIQLGTLVAAMLWGTALLAGCHRQTAPSMEPQQRTPSSYPTGTSSSSMPSSAPTSAGPASQPTG